MTSPQPAAPAAKLSTGAIRRKALAAIKEALRDGGWAVTFGRAAETALAALDAAGLEITEKTK
jgi:hypothetical protein